MKLDFRSLSKNNDKEAKIEPRDIFRGLHYNQYNYPRDVQSNVWEQWYKKRNDKNNIIKMNTGSGKTVVGLIILQSCLNESKGPAVYVVPNKFLVEQVCNEAIKLGIKVTQGVNDYKFINGESILVTNIYTIFNGKSSFGMKQDPIKIGSIIIDDVHSCLDTIEKQHTINISSEQASYRKIIEIFEKNSDIKDNGTILILHKKKMEVLHI